MEVEEKVYLDDMVMTFSQYPDCNQEGGDDFQTLEVHLENNGLGRYIWFKTDRWAISDGDDFQKLVDRIREMEKINDKYENGYESNEG